MRRKVLGIVALLISSLLAGCHAARQCETYKPAVTVVPAQQPVTTVIEAKPEEADASVSQVVVQPTKTVVVARPKTVVVAPSPRRAVRRAVRRHHFLWH